MNRVKPTDHEKDCECLRCTGQWEELERRQAAFMRHQALKEAEHGWFAHFVFDAPNTATGTNAHTHGLEQSCGHLDFQIVLPLPPHVVNAFFFEFTDRVKQGEKFSDGEVNQTKNGVPIKFVKVIEDHREVLRIIFADLHGELDPENMPESYEAQYPQFDPQ